MKFTVSLLSLFVASLAAAPSPVQSADAKIAMIQAEAEASASPVPSPSPAPSPSAAPASPSTNPIVWPTTQRQKIAIQQAGSAAGTVGDQCPYNKKFKDLYIPGVNLKDLSYCAQLCFRDAWNLSECCAPTRRCACSSKWQPPLRRMPTVKDQDSKPIKEGDTVWTKIRGGKREGEVERVVTSEEEAKSEGVKNPPKVLFTDQHGHDVAHNPETLQHSK
ncbi:uncharacterized protein E0L32_009183 [Thyridium curvatum]|uniref:Hypervirulence associated protein TUDOR domain-containing protein n=1 Tax=Thyridium curvatum TaxID=1093900 RepID=A0A507AJI5_9PEZI|nr:uncharacterized protein E0L32_009183 [Thyridium curvatum]TPX09582.1 hypothetical protein E0L32_009183 [Thyridium curvatum]